MQVFAGKRKGSQGQYAAAPQHRNPGGRTGKHSLHGHRLKSTSPEPAMTENEQNVGLFPGCQTFILQVDSEHASAATAATT